MCSSDLLSFFSLHIILECIQYKKCIRRAHTLAANFCTEKLLSFSLSFSVVFFFSLLSRPLSLHPQRTYFTFAACERPNNNIVNTYFLPQFFFSFILILGDTHIHIYPPDAMMYIWSDSSCISAPPFSITNQHHMYGVLTEGGCIGRPHTSHRNRRVREFFIANCVAVKCWSTLWRTKISFFKWLRTW